MAKLTPLEFQAKYYRLFADNEIQNITEATFREWTLDMSDSFAGQDKGPNDTVGGIKYVIYLTREEAIRAGRPTYASLDQVKNTSIVLGNLARIDLLPGAPGTWLTAVYDDGLGPYPFGPGFAGIADGTGALNFGQLPGTGLLPMKWVLKDSPEAATANVPLYKKGTTYRENDLVRGLFGTFPDVKSSTFRANESGNDLPAPSRVDGDAYWSVFNPAPPVTFPWQTVTPEELRQLQGTGKLSAGRLYIVSPRLIADDPEDRAYPDVFVRALMESELEATGWLLLGAGAKQLVNYDLATDTTTPAGGATNFAELLGDPRDNGALGRALSGLGQPFVVAGGGGLRGYPSAQAAADAAPAGATLYCYADVYNGIMTRQSLHIEAPGRYINQFLVAENTVCTARFRETGGVQMGGNVTADFQGDMRVNTTGDSALFGYNVKLRWTGNVYYNSTNPTGGAFYIVGPEATFDYLAGTLFVLQRGAGILAGDRAEVSVRGNVVSKDVCLVQGNGALDVYGSLSNQASTTGRSALVVSQNAAFFKNMTLHAGSEVLGPDSVAVITNSNPGQVAVIQVAGALASTGPVPENVQYQYLTTAPAGGGTAAPAYVLPAATATRRGGVLVGPGLTVEDTGRLSASVATLSSTTLVLTQDAEYAPIFNGTFTLDPTDAKVGAVIFAYLGPATSAPTLPTSCQLLSGTYQAGKSLMYAFKVGANAAIQYTISVL